MRRVLLVAFVVAAVGSRARAADITDVASSFDEGNVFDFRLRLRYDHTETRAQIKRELEGLPNQTRIQTFKDLLYEQTRDTVTLRAEVGIYHDLMLHVELPIVVGENARYSYDQSASNCLFPSPNVQANCVNAANSTTIADGIVPVSGFDATTGMGTSGALLFRGANRGAQAGTFADGLDTVNLGLTWAPLAQHRDDTRPTWTITVEGRISVGNLKQFDRAHPLDNHAVSDGTHKFVVRTDISRRFRYFEPYWGLWYLLPIPRDSSLFKDYGDGQKTKNPQMQGGTLAGVELIPLDMKKRGFKLAIDLRGRVEAHFTGRGYSEAWELWAGSDALKCDPAFNPACSLKNPYQGQPFTGLTTIDNYSTLGADIALSAQISPYFHLRAGFDYTRDQAHLISGDDIGNPSTSSGRVMFPQEFNPAYRPVIDLPGRRYFIDNVNSYNAYVWAQGMF
jgi:hypothetical protein